MGSALAAQGGQFYQQQLQNLGALQGTGGGMGSPTTGLAQLGTGAAAMGSFLGGL